MKIIELAKREDMAVSPKLDEVYTQFNNLVDELNRKQFPDSTTSAINKKIEELNVATKTGNSMKRLILNKQAKILKLISKEHKIVPKNYYRTLWLALGMSAFGIPIGVAIGLSVGNIGLLAIGLPIGLAIGTAVGSVLDQKALKEGRQLNIELKRQNVIVNVVLPLTNTNEGVVYGSI